MFDECTGTLARKLTLTNCNSFGAKRNIEVLAEVLIIGPMSHYCIEMVLLFATTIKWDKNIIAEQGDHFAVFLSFGSIGVDLEAVK